MAKELHSPLLLNPDLPLEDEVGHATLQTFLAAQKFNQWMAATIRPFLLSGLSLEIGAGIGNIARHIASCGHSLILTDKSPVYLPHLKTRFQGFENVKGIYLLDISAQLDVDTLDQSVSSFDNVYSINVLEHIEHDLEALIHCHQLLRKGGRLIKLVPAHPALFNHFDINLGHFRRYTPHSLRKKMERAGFRVIHQQFFNLPGILGWWFSGKWMQKKQIPLHQMQLFERMVPLFRRIDPLFQSWLGLSLICIGEKID